MHHYMQNFNQNRLPSEGNIKGAGLPVDIYLTLLEESTHWQELWGRKCI